MFFDTRTPPRTRLDAGLPVLLLRTDRNHFHHGTLAAIRSLGRAGVPVHAIMEGPANPAARSRYLHRRHPWAPPTAYPSELLSHLRAIAERIGRETLLVPMDDAGAIFVAEHADSLRLRPRLPHTAGLGELASPVQRIDDPHPAGGAPPGRGRVAGRRAVVALRTLPRDGGTALLGQDGVAGTAFREGRHEVLVRPQVAGVLQDPRVREPDLVPHAQQQPPRRAGELRRQRVVVHIRHPLITFPTRMVCSIYFLMHTRAGPMPGSPQ